MSYRRWHCGFIQNKWVQILDTQHIWDNLSTYYAGTKEKAFINQYINNDDLYCKLEEYSVIESSYPQAYFLFICITDLI